MSLPERYQPSHRSSTEEFIWGMEGVEKGVKTKKEKDRRTERQMGREGERGQRERREAKEAYLAVARQLLHGARRNANRGVRPEPGVTGGCEPLGVSAGN